MRCPLLIALLLSTVLFTHDTYIILFEMTVFQTELYRWPELSAKFIFYTMTPMVTALRTCHWVLQLACLHWIIYIDGDGEIGVRGAKVMTEGLVAARALLLMFSTFSMTFNFHEYFEKDGGNWKHWMFFYHVFGDFVMCGVHYTARQYIIEWKKRETPRHQWRQVEMEEEEDTTPLLVES